MSQSELIPRLSVLLNKIWYYTNQYITYTSGYLVSIGWDFGFMLILHRPINWTNAESQFLIFNHYKYHKYTVVIIAPANGKAKFVSMISAVGWR